MLIFKQIKIKGDIMDSRKLMACILTVIMLSGIFLTGFTYQSGIGNVYYETKSEIYDHTTYHEQLAGHYANGIQRAYFIKTDTRNTTLKPYVFEGEVTGTYTMDTMISTLEEEGYKVLAGINGDLFDKSSGASKGLTIHDYKIKTSGYAPEYVISFNEEGNASLEKVNLEYTLKGMINIPTGEEPTQPEDSTSEEQRVYVPIEYNEKIGFFNVPKGAAKALHLYNRNYASSTKTAETSVEVILDAGSPENAELKVGGTITATVVEVRNGDFDTPIGDSQLVLSAVWDSTSAVQLSQLIPGSQVEISVKEANGGNLMHSKEAIGIYYLLYDNNQFISTGTNLNPRTIIGIKPDGTLILYVLDGNQPGFSTGLGLTDVTKHLVALGCSTVVNMDGGGSSVMNVREGGIDSSAVMKNSPSNKAQRKTTNGLLLVYDMNGDSSLMNLHTYPSQPLVMPGMDIQLKTYGSNNRYEPVPLIGNVEYSLDSSLGNSLDQNGLFTAGSNIGTAVIEVRSGELSTTTKVDIQNDITFETNIQSLTIDPGESFDINVTGKYGYAPIASKDSLFTWSCDPNIGIIDENGSFQGSNESGLSGNIYVEYNGKEQVIPVKVGDQIIDFEDTKTHWARISIGKLAGKKIVNGMGNNLYLPDTFLTRAQFLTMLANTVPDLDATQAAPAGFADVSETEWYYATINWGFENGIVSGMGDSTFAPNEKITREQMVAMLVNFTDKTGLELPIGNEEVSFTDQLLISPWAEDSVNKIVSAGIMSGYPEGDFKPQGNATRGEAASVIYRLITIKTPIE